MIIIFGGTTEGRIAAETLDEAGKNFFYSTKGSIQEVNCKNLVRISGGMTSEEMISFCRENNIRAIIDAAHPFAEVLHANIAIASENLNIPVIRLERIYPDLQSNVTLCANYEDAIRKLYINNVQTLLALTGTQTIKKLKPFWQHRKCIFRILDREESLKIALSECFPKENIRYYEGSDAEEKLINEVRPDAIITKESGLSGGFEEKVLAANKANIQLYVVKRPKLSEKFITVTGKHSLRRAVEQNVPDFYELKTGLTTGSCATAATKAAMLALVNDEFVDRVSISLPNGELVDMNIEQVEKIDDHTAQASIIKFSGDDPDVTNGVEIISTVSFSDMEGIHFLQGKGVGTVTLPGVGLPIGSPAINKTPQETIRNEVRSVYAGGINVTISVTNGEEIATRTFNPKIGIVGGISIIGTSGVVLPFSSEAFVNAIRKEVEVAKAIGSDRLVINSGAKSERFVKAVYPDLPSQAFVHYGNFIGETLEIAQETGFKKVTMGIMIGKAVKLAEGHLDTHSKKVVMNKDFLKQVAIDSLCTEQMISHIDNMSMAREIWSSPNKDDMNRFANRILQLCKTTCQQKVDNIDLTLMLIKEDGSIHKTDL